jgi:5'-nucleotidase / UDP-sugar diphosphatase
MVTPQFIKQAMLLVGGISLLNLLTLEPAQAASFTIFHNNDGESKLFPSSTGEAGAAEFITLLDSLRNQSQAAGRIPLTLSSGDNFLASTAFNASLTDGIFYDALVLNRIGYDAIAFGNHDFDFGPDILADFLGDMNPAVPYILTNADFSGEPGLNALVGSQIKKSVVIDKGGEKVGVVGAMFERLNTISTPRNVVISAAKDAIQAEINLLQAQGINKIILISHLQDINEELALIPQLSGIDVVIAGGGDDLLTNNPNNLLPSDLANVNAVPPRDTIVGPYPLQRTDRDGNPVVVITTAGEYKYVGKLDVDFNSQGIITSANGQAVRVLKTEAPGAPDATIVSQVLTPVKAAQNELAKNIIALSEVPLNGVRSDVRSRETNLGNLIADALLWQGQQLAASVGAKSPVIALQNGGGIRNNAVIPAGNISELDTFNALPFSNFVAVFDAITPAKIKEVLENAYSNVANQDGRFAQIAGFKVGIDVTAPVGSRVIDVTLDDGTVLVSNGKVLPNAPSISVATIDFLANGGDGYPFGGAPFTNVGASYQQALFNYVKDELGGKINAADYPVGGEGRIFAAKFDPTKPDPSTSVPEPGLILGLLTLGGFGATLLKRQ